MTESPEITLSGESRRHLGAAADIWRHEGLKRGVEWLLYQGGMSETASFVMEKLAGGEITDPRLATELGGLALAGPIGVGAGWDKHGTTALGWQALGMRHITPGGITYWPQTGLEMPRLRTFDKKVGDHGTSKSLNAFGFYSPGAFKVREHLQEQRQSGRLRIPIIGQVTLNKEFYEAENRKDIPHMLAATIRELLPVVDGISLGLSSPNTLGMRDSQDQYEFIYANVAAAREATHTSTRTVPLSYKGDGDGGEPRLEMLCRVVDETDADGLELINTTALEHIKARYGVDKLPGGLAGGDREYQDLAVACVRYAYEAIGDRKSIHGMGGVGFGPDVSWQALRLLRAGASVVSVNTGIRHLGHRTPRLIERGIQAELNRHPEITALAQIIGADTSRGPKQKLAA